MSATKFFVCLESPWIRPLVGLLCFIGRKSNGWIPVLIMQLNNWQGNNIMLSNDLGSDMSGNHNLYTGGHKTQDDATVRYLFQRPKPDMIHQYNSKRWTVGDDSAIKEVRRCQTPVIPATLLYITLMCFGLSIALYFPWSGSNCMFGIMQSSHNVFGIQL